MNIISGITGDDDIKLTINVTIPNNTLKYVFTFLMPLECA
jgi:hypothetical protein